LLNLAQSLGVERRLHLPGFATEVQGLLEAGNIYVQPSRCETQGYGLLEALAMGLPAVVSRVGGMPEVIESGANGLVVMPDDPVALAGAVTDLAKDDSRRVRLGDAGRRRVEDSFSVSTMRHRTFELYRNVFKHSRDTDLRQ
jgi:glycosyltransferase involved in cell wall biosynthesis